MIHGYSPVVQALLGTLFTWGLTAAGAALVFLFVTGEKRILDGSLGFAAGVMLAASYWSLLAPAIEMAEESGKYGAFAFFPVAVGFLLGATFVYGADLLMPVLGAGDNAFINLALGQQTKHSKEKDDPGCIQSYDPEMSIRIDKIENGEVHYRRRGNRGSLAEDDTEPEAFSNQHDRTASSWRRIMLLILAITIHNIPEGLAVGVGFGAVGKTSSATFEGARHYLWKTQPQCKLMKYQQTSFIDGNFLSWDTCVQPRSLLSASPAVHVQKPPHYQMFLFYEVFQVS
ncbi:zinc transporter ZIP11-like isoform X2 [Erpetoichthys calabaricus]|uniref:zinc transporter ZIP11-like isoform X2 n=1 Tax=Erpetoichthys calabaricus TaxID=27687 RepID=UPI002234074C|nr:zinc transporter ZIP11-like isoform X2 [Erpetoichthys calabaricus]